MPDRARHPDPADLPPEAYALWFERAAIMEYDGGQHRERAEALALAEVLAAAAPVRAPEPPAGGWLVWFRPRRGVPWALVARAASPAAAAALIGCGGRRGGDWLVRDREGPPDAAHLST